MKKIFAILIATILCVNIAIAYTTTIKAKGTGVVITSNTGNTVTVQETDQNITGWEITPNTVEFTNNQFTMPETNVELNAIYNVQTYTVTFNANNGTNETKTQTYIEGISQKLRENTFTNAGSIFAGWSTTANGQV